MKTLMEWLRNTRRQREAEKTRYMSSLRVLPPPVNYNPVVNQDPFEHDDPSYDYDTHKEHGLLKEHGIAFSSPLSSNRSPSPTKPSRLPKPSRSPKPSPSQEMSPAAQDERFMGLLTAEIFLNPQGSEKRKRAEKMLNHVVARNRKTVRKSSSLAQKRGGRRRTGRQP